MHFVKLVVFSLGPLGCLTGARAVNFDGCLADITHTNISDTARLASLQGSITNNHGTPINLRDALDDPDYPCPADEPLCFVTSFTYQECVATCGAGPEPFAWATFSQQFGAWLLPWLALVSQLPFGARMRVDNLMSVLLAIGSPTLAAFSLVSTVLNTHWLARRFQGVRYPNVRLAVRSLSSLQQSPLRVSNRDGLLASLVVLHQNDEWWAELVHWLEYTHTWSISAVTNLLWVAIAYVFTVINAFTEISQEINANGQANGSLWLWLLPIVIGWLQISPKCDADRLEKAIEHANDKAWVATDNDGVVDVKDTALTRRALDFHKSSHDALFDDQHASAPIYNYSRIFCWARVAEKVAIVFEAANAKAEERRPVARDGQDYQLPQQRGQLTPHFREGSRSDVEAYCESCKTASYWVHGVWTRIVVASAVALALQWATTGSAVIIVWYTPTTGLGCRSGAYLLYGLLSTIVWILMLLSSILVHYSTIPTEGPNGEAGPNLTYEMNDAYSASSPGSSSVHADKPPSSIPKLSATLGIALRRMGKLIATVNACFVIVACVFQFSNFFNRCYCNSSVFAHGVRDAYDVVRLTDSDISDLKSAWSGGVVLATVTAAAFTFFVNIYINPPLPGIDSSSS